MLNSILRNICEWICSIVNIVVVDVVDIKLMMIIALENVKYVLGINKN